MPTVLHRYRSRQPGWTPARTAERSPHAYPKSTGITAWRRVIGAILAATFRTGPRIAKVLAPRDDIAFGARPGNVMDTSSLPTPDQANNITEASTRSRIPPPPPSAQTMSDSPHHLFRAALQAPDAGCTGEAQEEGLERTETRLLRRCVPTRVGRPSAEALVSPIAAPRHLPADRYREQAVRPVEVTLRPDVTHAAG
jgi:hypothetical protein